MRIFSKNLTSKTLKNKTYQYLKISSDLIKRNIFKKHTSPDFLIVGAQKAGTSALAFYLSQHPQIQIAERKEVNFFNSSDYSKGLKYYEKQFPIKSFPSKYFEATPGYMYVPQAIKRIYEFDNTLKLIIILREPISRSYSAWNMFREIHENPTSKDYFIKNYLNKIEDDKARQNFIELLINENYPNFISYIKKECESILNGTNILEPSFIQKSIYYPQMKNIYKYFDKSQVLILESTELKQKRIETLNKIATFLNISSFNNLDLNLNSISERHYLKKIPEDAEKLLKSFFSKYNEKLFNLIGEKYDWENKT